MKIRCHNLGLLVGVLGMLGACSGAVPKKDAAWDMYAIPSANSAPYDNDYYYRAPAAGGNDLAKRCNSIGDMPSCGSD